MHPGYSRDVSGGNGTRRKLKNGGKKRPRLGTGLDFWGFAGSGAIDGLLVFGDGCWSVVFGFRWVVALRVKIAGFLYSGVLMVDVRVFGVIDIVLSTECLIFVCGLLGNVFFF